MSTDLKLKLKIDTREANRALEAVHDLATKEAQDIQNQSLAAETAEQVTAAIEKLDQMADTAKEKLAETKQSIKDIGNELSKQAQTIADRVRKEFAEGQMKLTKEELDRGIHSFKDKYGTEDLNEAIHNAQVAELTEIENKLNDCVDAQRRYNNEIADAEKLRGAMVGKEKAMLPYSGRSYGNAFARSLEQSLRRIPSIISGAFRKGLNLAKRAASSLFSYLTRGMRSSFLGAGSAIDMITGRLGKWGIAMLGVRSAFTGLRKAVSAYMSENEDVANRLTSIWTSLGNLLGPLINWVTDKVLYLIGVLNGLLNVLFGVNLKVKQVGSSASGTGSALSGAGAAAKEASKELSAFDEINKLSDPSSSSGGGSGGSGSGGSGSYVDMEPIDIGLKDLIEKGDWEGVGKLFANKLNTLTSQADKWINSKFKPWAKKFAKNLGDGINGFVEEYNWDVLGTTIADGMMAIVNAANTFLTTTKWEELGTKIGTAVSSWFSGMDWDSVATMFANKLNAWIKTVKGFVTTIFNGDNAVRIGETIASAVATWFDTVSWADIAKTITTGFNGAVTALKTLVKDEKTITSIKTALQTLVDGLDDLDVSGLAETLSDAVINGLDILSDSGVLYKAGEKIGEFLGNIKWGNLLKSALNASWALMKGAWDGFWSGDHANELAGIIVGALAAKLALKKVMANISVSLGKVATDSTASAAESNALKSAIEGFLSLGPGTMFAWTAAGLTLAIALAVTYDITQMGDANKAVRDDVEASKNAGIDYNEILKRNNGDVEKAQKEYLEKIQKWRQEIKIPVTAVADKFDDDISKKDKKVNNATADATEVKDSIPKKNKKIDSFAGELTSYSDGINTNKNLSGFGAKVTTFNDKIDTTKHPKKLGGYQANITNGVDKINTKKTPKLLGGYSANITTGKNSIKYKWLDYGADIKKDYNSIPDKDRWLKYGADLVKDYDSIDTKSLDYTANLKYVTDALTDNQKTISVTAKISKMKNEMGITLAGGGILIGNRWQNIQAYASGGAQRFGQLFVAREAGPELVGTIGGHSAVMNNNQIVSSVAAGVANAVSGVLANGLIVRPAAPAGNYTSSLDPDSADIDSLMERFAEVLAKKLSIEGGVVQLNIDGKKVTEAVNVWNKKLSFAGNM